MINKPDLSIIIVTYNSSDQISNLLDSIYSDQTGIKLEVIVVDNQSSDNSLNIAEKHKIGPVCIQMGINSGFSAAVNRGLAKARADYFLLLNPDTQVKKGALKKMLDFARDTTPLGAVVPRLLDTNGHPQPSAFKFPTITNAIRKDFFGSKISFGKYLPENKTQKLEVAVMAAFMIPRTTYETVGGLNEKYFLYFEDVDYCRELYRKGLPIYYLPSAKIKHVHGASGRFVSHHKSPLLRSSKIYYGEFYSNVLNLVLWLGHKWQVILRGKRFRD